MEKSKINDKIYDVISYDDYTKNRNSIDPNLVAIRDGEHLYPIRAKTSNLPGLYSFCSGLDSFKEPLKDDEQYLATNTINFSNAKSLRDIIEKQNKLKSAERAILTDPDNIFTPILSSNDSPEMIGLKEAVIAKNIDIDKYQARFGSNYSNDKRLFNDESITLSKLKTMFKALDMKGTLIIEDLNENVPNPIGKKIQVDLLGGDNDD